MSDDDYDYYSKYDNYNDVYDDDYDDDYDDVDEYPPKPVAVASLQDLCVKKLRECLNEDEGMKRVDLEEVWIAAETLQIPKLKEDVYWYFDIHPLLVGDSKKAELERAFKSVSRSSPLYAWHAVQHWYMLGFVAEYRIRRYSARATRSTGIRNPPSLTLRCSLVLHQILKKRDGIEDILDLRRVDLDDGDDEDAGDVKDDADEREDEDAEEDRKLSYLKSVWIASSLLSDTTLKNEVYCYLLELIERVEATKIVKSVLQTHPHLVTEFFTAVFDVVVNVIFKGTTKAGDGTKTVLIYAVI